jgi:hypothetical protein
MRNRGDSLQRSYSFGQIFTCFADALLAILVEFEFPEKADANAESPDLSPY